MNPLKAYIMRGCGERVIISVHFALISDADHTLPAPSGPVPPYKGWYWSGPGVRWSGIPVRTGPKGLSMTLLQIMLSR